MFKISVVNQKGGVGKTSVAINLASALAVADLKILLIDFDSQAHVTVGLGIEPEYTIYDVLVGNVNISEAIMKTPVENLWLVPSDENLAAFDVEFAEREDRNEILKNALKPLGGFDFVFIDCPPSLSLLTINALCASDFVLIPVVAEFYSLDGFARLLKTIDAVKENYNPSLEILGIVVNMLDRRVKLSKEVIEEFRKFFPDKVFETMIPRNVKVAEAPSHGLPVIMYDPRSSGADAFGKLAQEFLQRIKQYTGKKVAQV